MQNAQDSDAFELVNVADWEHLMAFYGTESSLPGSHPARRWILCLEPCNQCWAQHCTVLQAHCSIHLHENGHIGGRAAA